MSTSRFHFLLFIIFGLGIGELSAGSKNATKKQVDCQPSRLQQCMDLLQTINKDHNLAFASTEKELNKMCSTMESGLECVHNHVTRCFDEARQRVIYQLLTGTEDVIQSLCTKGKFRDEYQIYAPCMKNLSTDNQVCGIHYKTLIHSVNPPEKLEFQESIRLQCCAFHDYLMCVTSAAEKECGREASEFIEQYTYRTAGPIIQTRCKMYVPGSLQCTYSNAALSKAASFLGLSLLWAAPLLLVHLL